MLAFTATLSDKFDCIGTYNNIALGLHAYIDTVCINV